MSANGKVAVVLPVFRSRKRTSDLRINEYTPLKLIWRAQCRRMPRHLACVPAHAVAIRARIEPRARMFVQPRRRMTRDRRTVKLARRRMGTSRTSKTSLVATRSTPSCATRPLSLRRAGSHGSPAVALRAASAPSRSICNHDGPVGKLNFKMDMGKSVPLLCPKAARFHEGHRAGFQHKLGPSPGRWRGG